jgi:hypothetical protein
VEGYDLFLEEKSTICPHPDSGQEDSFSIPNYKRMALRRIRRRQERARDARLAELAAEKKKKKSALLLVLVVSTTGLLNISPDILYTLFDSPVVERITRAG